MTPLQFSLFFAALLVGYVLVHLRLVRFESYLRKVPALEDVDQRLRGIAEVLQRVRLERVEERLERIHADLEAVVAALERMESSAPRTVTVVSEPAAPQSDGARIRALVEGRLLAMGCSDVRVLTDLSEASLEDETRVVVECVRGGMPCKGHVVTQNGAVRDVDLRSVAASFP